MKYARAAIAGVLILLPTFAYASAPQTFQELAATIVLLLDNATGVLIVFALVVYFYGISVNIIHFGEGHVDKFKARVLWGIVVLTVMVSVWGILQLLQATLFGGDAAAPGAGGIDVNNPNNPFQAPTFNE